MFKSRLLLLICCAFSTQLLAQNVGEARFDLPHLLLPNRSLAEEFTTYSVDVSDPYDVLPAMGATPSQVATELALMNFKKVGAGGHMQVRYNIGSFEITNEQGKEQRTERENDDGTTTVTVKYYVELTYTFPIALEVAGYDGSILYDAVIGYEEDVIRYPRRGGFNSIREAENSWNENRGTQMREEAALVLSQSVLAMNEAIREQFDFRVGSDHLYFEFPKGNRAQNAVEWETHANQANAILAALPADQPMDVAGLRSQLQPHLDWWAGQMEQYDPGNRRERKYYHSALYNMGIVEYALENTAQVIAYMTQLESEVNWNRDRTRRLRRAAESLSGELNRYPDGTRRFTMRDLSEATAPSSNNAPAAFTPSEAVHPEPVILKPKKG